MSLREKRAFRHYVKFTEEGAVAAVVQVDASLPPPTDDAASVYVDVTASRRAVDVFTIAIDPAVLKSVAATVDAVAAVVRLSTIDTTRSAAPAEDVRGR